MPTVLPMTRMANAYPAQVDPKIVRLDDGAVAAVEIQEAVRQVHAVVVPATSVAQALAEADERSWGCVVADFSNGGHELVELAARLAKERPGFPLIIRASQLELPLAVELMKAGTIDILRKPLDDAALPATVQSAVRLGRERFLAWNQTREVTNRFAQLTESEKFVLSLVLQGRTNKEIAGRLDCSLRTVEARRQRVLRSMQSENAIELAVVLARRGLIDQALANAPESQVNAHCATA